MQQSLGVVDSRVEGGVRRDPLPVEILSSERTTMTAVKYNSQLVPVGQSVPHSVCLFILPSIDDSIRIQHGNNLENELFRSRSTHAMQALPTIHYPVSPGCTLAVNILLVTVLHTDSDCTHFATVHCLLRLTHTKLS